MSNRRKLMMNCEHHDYIVDTLFAWYDGINNAGVDQHNNSSTKWIDLSSNHNDITLTKSSWDENSLMIDNTVHGNFGSRFKYVTGEFIVKIDSTNGDVYGSCSIVNGLNGLAFNILANNHRTFFTDNYGDINKDLRYYVSSQLISKGSKISIQVIVGEIEADNNAYGWRCFVNGKELEVKYQHSGVNYGNYDINGRSDKTFTGNIYSMRFHNRILTESELINNYKVDKKRYNL